MNWRTLIVTFGAIFLAEMGDKTQLSAITLAAATKHPWAVFGGASIALVVVSALGVAVGTAVGSYLPLAWIRRVAGGVFIAIGVLMLFEKM